MTPTSVLNEFTFGQEGAAQLQTADLKENIIVQQPVAQIESSFIHSFLSKINWESHIILMNSNVPLGLKYWYMRQAIGFGWSRNILDLQIKNNLFQRK